MPERATRKVFGQCMLLAALGCGLSGAINPARAQEQTFGVIVSLTGPFAAFGTEIVEGLRAATSGSGLKISIADDGGDLGQARFAFSRLVQADKVSLVVGFPTAGAVAAVSPLAQELSVPIIHLSAYTDPKVSGRPGITFGLVPSAASLIDAVAEFSKGSLQIKSPAILYGISTQSERLAERLNSQLRGIGFGTVEMQRIAAFDDSFRITSSLRASEVMVLGSLPVERLPPQLRTIVIDPMPPLRELARGSGNLVSAPQASRSADISLEGRDDRQPASWRAYGFTLGEILVQVHANMRGDGSPQRAARILQEQEFRTLFGAIRFDPRTGSSNLKPVLSRFDRGRLTFLEACSRCSEEGR